MAEVDRRRALQVAALSLAATASSAARAGIPGNTAAVPLVAETISVAAVQSHAGSDIAANIAAMARAVEASAPKHLIAFHALALHDAGSVTLDGPEIAAVAALARRHGVHIAFAALTADAAWPGRVIPRNILIDDHGRVVLAAWRAADIEPVLDRFAAMYGADSVLPVAHTSIGSIALASDHAAPEIYRTFALKGADIVVRLTQRASAPWDVQAACAYNQFFTLAPAPAAALRDDADDGAALRGGGSLIVGARGETLAEAGSAWTQTISAAIPLAHHRVSRQPITAYARLMNATV
jgi:predicted amidohydrolase